MSRRQLGQPFRINIDMTGGAGAHAAADRSDAIVEIPQVFHQREGGVAFDVMLDAIPVGYLDQSHERSMRLQRTRNGAFCLSWLVLIQLQECGRAARGGSGGRTGAAGSTESGDPRWN